MQHFQPTDVALAIATGTQRRLPSESEIQSFIDHLRAEVSDTRIVREIIEIIQQRGNLAAEAVSAAFDEVISSLERLASGEKAEMGLAQSFCSYFFSLSLKRDAVSDTEPPGPRRQILWQQRFEMLKE